MGEMTLARDLLALLTFTSVPNDPSPSSLPAGSISATTVTNPPAIPSVQAFDTQLNLGSKDESLRKAANIFWEASESMERSRKHDEAYWVAALTARQGNWGLTPAPQPHGQPAGKGTDKSARDFVISFGLEECVVEVLCLIVF